MTIEYASKNDLKQLEKILKEHDYTLVEENVKNNPSTETKTTKRLEQFAI